jgi:hypothetical protein
MSSPIPFLPPILETVNEMLATKKIPALSGDEMETLCSHLFALRDRDQRIAMAEIAYLNHQDPQALDVFLACTIPLAQKMSQQRAYRIYEHPSAWALEAMYDGAVTALLTMFLRHAPLSTLPDAFRRYLTVIIIKGSLRDYFKRHENFGIYAMKDIAGVAVRKNLFRDPVDDEVLTRKVLEQVINFPHLRDEHRAVLQAIATLGPDVALKQHAFTNKGDPGKWRNRRNIRPILNPDAIAAAMGLPKRDVHRYLCQMRPILRDVFNRDGSLFSSY